MKKYLKTGFLVLTTIIITILLINKGSHYSFIESLNIMNDNYLWRSINIFPLYSIVFEFSFFSILKNILFGIFIGAVLFAMVNNKSNNFKNITYIVFSYLSEALRCMIGNYVSHTVILNNVLSFGSFNIDYVILRFLGCLISYYIIKKIIIVYEKK